MPNPFYDGAGYAMYHFHRESIREQDRIAKQERKKKIAQEKIRKQYEMGG